MFTFFVLMIGLEIVVVPAGLVVSVLSQAWREEDDKALAAAGVGE